MTAIIGIIRESYSLLNRMSIYLVLGLLFAGILHIFIRPGVIAKHLGKDNFWSVVKASLFGIPLPLCSCGVIPAALSLRKDGASKGSVISFLISTPTTGVDSIFATYALLGGFFTAYRVLASFITAVFAGTMSNLFSKAEEETTKETKKDTCKVCCGNECEDESHSLSEKIKGVFTYAFRDLLGDIGGWLLLGIFIGGIISYFIPEEFVMRYLSSGWLSMILMLIIGIPMYVCSSGSLPIAAALMLKGMNPGAAFVFLMTGPVTNSVAFTVIARQLGRRIVIIFLISIVVCSLTLGFILNMIWQYLDIDIISHMTKHADMIPFQIEMAASLLLVVGIIISMLTKHRKPVLK